MILVCQKTLPALYQIGYQPQRQEKDQARTSHHLQPAEPRTKPQHQFAAYAMTSSCSPWPALKQGKSTNPFPPAVHWFHHNMHQPTFSFWIIKDQDSRECQGEYLPHSLGSSFKSQCMRKWWPMRSTRGVYFLPLLQELCRAQLQAAFSHSILVSQGFCPSYLQHCKVTSAVTEQSSYGQSVFLMSSLHRSHIERKFQFFISSDSLFSPLFFGPEHVQIISLNNI